MRREPGQLGLAVSLGDDDEVPALGNVSVVDDPGGAKDSAV
jgi:hypothetical protein